jgi:hypothetical protein
MIAEVVDTAIALGWALLAWIAVGAALGTLLLLGVAAVVAWLWRIARRSTGARKGLKGPLASSAATSDQIPDPPAERPSEALWALDPHDTGETPKPPVPV